MVKSRYIGDGHPTFNRESLQWVYKPLRTWVDFPIPYYMEIMGVDRPDRTYIYISFLQFFLVGLLHCKALCGISFPHLHGSQSEGANLLTILKKTGTMTCDTPKLKRQIFRYLRSTPQTVANKALG